MAKKDLEINVNKKKKKKKARASVMPIEKDSYIIVRQGSKHKLALAINPERNRAVIDSSLIDDEPQYVEYDENNLVCNLGAKPKLGGTAFGVRIEPYVTTIDTRQGPIHFFREITDLEKKAFRRALKRTFEGMAEKNLNVFPLGCLRVLPKRGSYAGMYHFRRKGGEVTDRIDLFPATLEDTKYNEYVLYHEYGHAVWYRMCDDQIKAKWIKLYHKRLELTSVLKDRLDPMLDELLKFTGSLKDFLKELEDEDRLIFREVLAYYRRYHKMDQHAMDILHMEDTAKFASMWPKRTTIVEVLKDDPSAYAMTKVEELFAESFAFHMTGKTLSKDLAKAMDKTLIKLQSA